MFVYTKSAGSKWAIMVQKVNWDWAAHDKLNSNVMSEETVHKYLNTYRGYKDTNSKYKFKLLSFLTAKIEATLEIMPILVIPLNGC